jgi:hypothetical protein
MTAGPVICFGQQPCGIFPRRFLFAKIATARRLQAELGGRLVFFYHDSDHDPRETQTCLRHRQTGAPLRVNFAFANRLQRKFSPLYLKRVTAATVADFCLEMYRRMGLLEGIEVVRSGDPAVRRAACAVPDFYVDVPHEGEIVRARFLDGVLKLHEGGDSYLTLPMRTFTPEQVSPTRDTRLRWMQSVVHCTHYVAGASEQDYLRREDAPEITYLRRDPIERSDEAYTEIPA